MSLFNIIHRILKKVFLMKKILLCSSGILLVFFISLNAHASLVFNQPPYTTAGGVVSSPYDPFFLEPGTVYDDFMLTTTSSITGITWVGVYAYVGGNIPPVTPAFTYTIYADNAGSPVTATSLAGGSVSPTGVPYTIGSIVIDQYSIALDGSFVATAGTKYWLS